MQEKKRGRMDIIHDILAIIQDKQGRIKPTHLMYKANLSHKQMRLYLDELIKGKMIEEEENEGRKMILINKKGREFLSKYLQMREFEKTFGL